MFQRLQSIKHKKLVAVAAGVASLALAGTAYAYFSSPGGTGNATVNAGSAPVHNVPLVIDGYASTNVSLTGGSTGQPVAPVWQHFTPH